ncbi:MAG TPA: phosphatase PAP2 family protein [Chitinophagaceae bacterium]
MPSPAPVDSFRSFSAIVRIPERKPRRWGFIRNVPSNLWHIARVPFQKENVDELMIVAGATAVLLWQDHRLTEGVGKVAEDVGMDPRVRYRPLLRLDDIVLLKAPDNINSALYQLGDGGTSLLLAGGLYIYGKMNYDRRSVQAAADVVETVITTAIATKTIKWMAGRQEPLKATQPGGRWRPFAKLSSFIEDKSNYDAFCSGHVTTLTATVTVLAENFPEKRWIRPVGYSLVGMLGFALANSRVHWVGDFPLAFALGYISGKITASRHMQASVRRRLMVP